MNFKTKTAAAGILAVLTVAAAAFVILPRHKKLPAPAAVQADKILVKKAERKLYLQKDGQNLKEYRIALGFAPVGDKLREDDGKTPEGIYRISGRNPNSRFYLSLRVSYPSAEDRREAAEKGFSPGGDIMIHGLPNKAPVFGQRPSSARLDCRLHRRYQRRNRRDLVNGCRRHDNRDSALNG